MTRTTRPSFFACFLSLQIARQLQTLQEEGRTHASSNGVSFHRGGGSRFSIAQ